MSIKLITFDLDNTLWDVDPVIRRAETKMLNYLDGAIPGYSQRVDQTVTAQLRDDVLRDDPGLRHDLSALRTELLTRAIAHCGLKAADAAHHAAQAFTRFLDARHEVTLFDDAHSTLQQLSSRYTLGALSNGNADVGRLDIGPYFSIVHSSASAGASKPDPAMFLAALGDIGIEPQQAVHIGDNLIDDVYGASRLGMHTIWVNFDGDTNDVDEAAPTLEVQALRQLPDAIETLIGSLNSS